MRRSTTDEVLILRWNQVRDRIKAADAVGILLGGGADLRYLTDYDAMPLERITALVGRTMAGNEPPTLIVPELEEARVRTRPSVYAVHTWDDTTDSVTTIASALPQRGRIMVSDNLWALHVLGLQRHSPNLEFVPISEAVGGLRSIKNPIERDALAAVGALADKVAAQIQNGEIPLVGRTEAEIADDIANRLVAVGHDTVEFVIVASGPNSASPHHDPGSRTVRPGEIVLFDFGGQFEGFCSDTTRCVHTGPVPAEVLAAYEVLTTAQEAAVQAAQPGCPLAEVDLAARRIISAGGYGDYFIHRIGHGIGAEIHEHPYVTELNTAPVQIGHAFSIEPGIYIPDQWGMRLEDIVVIEADGARRCNNSNRALVEV
ncbi:M24 family metallopeptidase [Candidatus Poriferisodalis sp.]|uniref:M24 family metallopeptidase n=1 Tax=Candidatus Poriferisodalis sp. TaxID=3101277 RepID=UPI003B01EBB5